MLLDAILRDATQNLQPLQLAMLDVSKAFDSVNHGAVLCVAARIGALPPHLQYIEQSYNGCVTYLECCRNLLILMTRGVKQGDPTLSPILFNSVLDEVMRNIPEDPERVGARLGETVPALAFADDLVLCAWTSSGLQQSLNVVQDCLTAVCLALNAGKSVTLAVAIDVKVKWYVFDTSKVSSRTAEPEVLTSQLRYLGI